MRFLSSVFLKRNTSLRAVTSEPRLESEAFTAYHTAPTPVETSTPPDREYIGERADTLQ